MNYAIILSGGIGTRMQMGDFPKQYLEVEKKPILLYTLEQFQKSSAVEKIVIVAAMRWCCVYSVHAWRMTPAGISTGAQWRAKSIAPPSTRHIGATRLHWRRCSTRYYARRIRRVCS